MKTITEHYAEVRERRARDTEQRRKRNREWVAALLNSDIPLYKGEAQSERLRAEMRALLLRDDGEPIGFACDHCYTEVVDRSPGCRTMMGQRIVGCPGCGWVGYFHAR